MEVIAWVSRHPPLSVQEGELKRLFGEIEIVQISKTFRDAREVFEDIKYIGAKYAVVVLPLSIIAQLIPLAQKEGIKLLWAEMVGIHECEGPDRCLIFNPETDVWIPLHGSKLGRHMRFKGFHEIVEVKMITKPL